MGNVAGLDKSAILILVSAMSKMIRKLRGWRVL